MCKLNQTSIFVVMAASFCMLYVYEIERRPLQPQMVDVLSRFIVVCNNLVEFDQLSVKLCFQGLDSRSYQCFVILRGHCAVHALLKLRQLFFTDMYFFQEVSGSSNAVDCR